MEINGHEEITGEEIDNDYEIMRDAGYKLTREQNTEMLKNNVILLEDEDVKVTFTPAPGWTIEEITQ